MTSPSEAAVVMTLSLEDLGHEGWLLDPAEVPLVEALAERRPDLCWLALHGKEGEDGTVQRLLDLLEIPYTGTAAFDCEVAFDKVLAKDALRRAGVPTPPWVVIEGWALRDLGGGAALGKAVERIGLPCVVKPSRSGSALGMSFVEREADLPQAVMAALSFSGAALIEAKVEGREVAERSPARTSSHCLSSRSSRRRGSTTTPHATRRAPPSISVRLGPRRAPLPPSPRRPRPRPRPFAFGI